MLVTIMSDASHCPDSNAAGYGYYVVCERGRIQGGSSFKSIVKSINYAETMGAINALFCARQHGLVVGGDTILVQLDSTNAIRYLENNEWEEWDRLTQGLTVIFRHVKAHSGIKDARSWANRYCDKIARKHMRTMRNNLSIEKCN